MYLKEYRTRAMEAASDRLSVQNRIPKIHTMMYHITCISDVKVRKMTKIRKRYNQVPHLFQDTKLESNKIQ